MLNNFHHNNGTHGNVTLLLIAPDIPPGKLYKVLVHYIASRIAFTGLSF